MEDSTLLRWHSGTQKRVERAKQSDQIDNEARLLWKSIVKTKHQSLTNLAFMRLVPGADRVVRHICIRCIISMNHNYYTMANIAVSFTSSAIRSSGCQIVCTKNIKNHVTTVPYINR